MSDEKKGAVLTGEELDEIARLAEACAYGDPWYTPEQAGDWIKLPKDRAFVAALTPAVVLRLVAEARKARLAAELFREHGEAIVGACKWPSNPKARAAVGPLESTIAAFRKGAE